MAIRAPLVNKINVMKAIVWRTPDTLNIILNNTKEADGDVELLRDSLGRNVALPRPHDVLDVQAMTLRVPGPSVIC